tara:strand:+ start:2654 stop:3013 length:360 start_codon:yes stop_codon:yes gene_type:complete
MPDINKEYDLIDSYKTLEEAYDTHTWNSECHSDKWDTCPRCEAKPRVWLFDNGRFAACKCSTKYDTKCNVHAISIGQYIRQNNGSMVGYPETELRDNWNQHCYDLDIVNRRNSIIDELI